MPHKLAVNFLRRVLGPLLKSQVALQQPFSRTSCNLLRCFACHVPVGNAKCSRAQLGRRSVHTNLLLPGHGTTGDSGEHSRAEGGGVFAAEKPYTMVGRLSSHMPSSSKAEFKDRCIMVLVSTVPAVGHDNSVGPEGGVPSQALLDTCAPNATGPTDEVLSRDSCSSSESSDDHQRRKGRGRQRLPCKYEGCKTKFSNFGFPDEDGTRCYRHRLLGMVPLYKPCEAPGCITQAVFGFPGENKKALCKAHKLEGMVNRNRPSCNEHDCTRPAVYGPEGERSPSVCRDHVVEGMIPIHHIPSVRCRSPGCMSQGTYAHPSDKRHKFCVEHKSDSMVSLGGSSCEEKGCTKDATFGWPDMGVWLRCRDHRQKGMVGTTQCTAEDCVKRPNFGYPGDETPSRCKEHMEKDMMDLNHKMMCDAPECKNKAYHALPGERASRCGKHKSAGMVNVIRKLCEVSECNRIAQFGVSGQARTRCSLHKEHGKS